MTPVSSPRMTPAASLSLDEAKKVGKKATMDQAGKAFEALFMQTMMKQMHEAKLGDGLFDGQGQAPFRSMLDQAYADLATTKMNLGLSDAIKRAYDPNAAKTRR